jgi:hypothetical protein
LRTRTATGEAVHGSRGAGQGQSHSSVVWWSCGVACAGMVGALDGVLIEVGWYVVDVKRAISASAAG